MQARIIYADIEGDDATIIQALRTFGGFVAGSQARLAGDDEPAQLPAPASAPQPAVPPRNDVTRKATADAPVRRRRSPEAKAKFKATMAAKREAKANAARSGDAVPQHSNSQSEPINPHLHGRAAKIQTGQPKRPAEFDDE